MSEIITGEEYLGNGVPKIEIESIEDFNILRKLTIKSPIKVVIKNDIDMMGDSKSFEPIDMSYFDFPITIIGTKKMVGRKTDFTLADNKYKIFNMAIVSSENNAGLFACVNKTLTVRNLIFEECTVIGGNNCGVLAGEAENMDVENCAMNSCSVIGCKRVGTLAGACENLAATNIITDANVEGDEFIGGLIGEVRKNAKIKNIFIYRPVISNCGLSINPYCLAGSLKLKECYNNGIKVKAESNTVTNNSIKVYQPQKRNKH